MKAIRITEAEASAIIMGVPFRTPVTFSWGSPVLRMYVSEPLSEDDEAALRVLKALRDAAEVKA